MSREAEKQTFENSVGPDGKRPVPQFHRIAYIRNDFPEKFGIPRQSGLVEELEALIVFVPEYRRPEALKGLEEYSHIWLLWEFSEAERGEWSPTVRPPRLGGNTRMGVFATRSPPPPPPVPSESHRALQCASGAGGGASGVRQSAPGPGRGSDGRDADSGHQALSAPCG